MNGAPAREWRRRWAAAIHDRRRALGLTQHQAAGLLGVGQSTLAGWEAARYVPVDVVKPRVVAVLGLDPVKLLAPLDTDPFVIGVPDIRIPSATPDVPSTTGRKGRR